MADETTQAPGRRYHYVITESLPVPNGIQYGTLTGVLTLGPAVTRSAALEYVRASLRAEQHWATGGNVLFFSLEPEQLTPAP